MSDTCKAFKWSGQLFCLIDLVFFQNLFNVKELRLEMIFVGRATKIKSKNLKTLAKIEWPDVSNNLNTLSNSFMIEVSII